MILILTDKDVSPGDTPADAGKCLLDLTPNAKQAAAIAETVWHRSTDGSVIMIKSRGGLPMGTPVTLFAVAELFGIKVDRAASADSAENILRDIVASIDRSKPIPSFWTGVLERAERVLNPQKS